MLNVVGYNSSVGCYQTTEKVSKIFMYVDCIGLSL